MKNFPSWKFQRTACFLSLILPSIYERRRSGRCSTSSRTRIHGLQSVPTKSFGTYVQFTWCHFQVWTSKQPWYQKLLDCNNNSIQRTHKWESNRQDDRQRNSDFPESGDVVKSIANLNICFASLAKLGVELREEVRIGILYAIMPSYMEEAKSILDETLNDKYTRASNKFIETYANRKPSSSPHDQVLITCFDCDEQGHIRRNCPSKKRQHQQSRKFCRFYKTHGHIIDECRKLKKKKNNGRNNRHRPNYQA